MSKPKKIIVTGASRGIGSHIVLELARRGHTVGCLSRKGTGPEILPVPPELAGNLVMLKGDVIDAESLKAAFQTFSDRVGGIDGIVNNAGYHVEAPSDRQDLAEFDEVMRTNSTAVFSACQQIYPHLKEKGGLIVNMGSFFDKLGVRKNAAYCASKAAVGALTRCLAVEWASKGIRVMDVAPGYIATDLNKDILASEKVQAWLSQRIPVGGPAAADAVATLVAMLFAENLPFLTGETIYLDGGQGMAL